jgi:predicted nucleic acid-binding protein
VLVYAAAGKRDDPAKHDIAARLVLQAQFAISAQVLGEFYGVVRYNQNEMLNMSEAQNWILRLTPFCKLDVSAGLVSSAMFIKERFKIQFWDAALIAATERLNLKTLYSEDMSHGQKYGSVTVINPFKASVA